MGDINIDFAWVDGKLIAVPSEKKKQPKPSVVDDELIDWVIREEGFLENPRDIGDGKITLGSGLTAQKWRDLYKQRGNKWSKEDNRKAVKEELEIRNKWAEDNIPNWGLLPSGAQKALLSYKYNYNFTPQNSPKLFKAMANKDFIEAMYQMDATSKNPKFKKGLEERRGREQQRGINAIIAENKPSAPPDGTFIARPDAMVVPNPYAYNLEHTVPTTSLYPTSANNSVEAIKASSEGYEENRIQEMLRNLISFNSMMTSMSYENQLTPQRFVSTAPKGINYTIGSYGEGGALSRKKWNDLSLAEKSEMIGVAVKNGITDLPTIRAKYNEFAEGGDVEEVNEHSSGGKIHIKPENRGKFTALKKRTGKSASWFKAHGTPAQRKMAVFELNARHWKHDLGGPIVRDANIYDGTTEDSQQMIILPGQDGFIYNGPTFQQVQQQIASNPIMKAAYDEGFSF